MGQETKMTSDSARLFYIAIFFLGTIGMILVQAHGN